MGIWTKTAGVWKEIAVATSLPVSPAVASGGTGSDVSDGGTNYRQLVFTADGTLTVTKAGILIPCLVGAGGGGGNAGEYSGGGGGGGEVLYLPGGIWVPVGTFAITIGARGATYPGGHSHSCGGSTKCIGTGLSLIAVGGGCGGGYAGDSPGTLGACGGGGAQGGQGGKGMVGSNGGGNATPGTGGGYGGGGMTGAAPTTAAGAAGLTVWGTEYGRGGDGGGDSWTAPTTPPAEPPANSGWGGNAKGGAANPRQGALGKAIFRFVV